MFLWMIIDEEIKFESKLIVKPSTKDERFIPFIDKTFTILSSMTCGFYDTISGRATTAPETFTIQSIEFAPVSGAGSGMLCQYNVTEEEIRENFYIEN